MPISVIITAPKIQYATKEVKSAYGIRMAISDLITRQARDLMNNAEMIALDVFVKEREAIQNFMRAKKKWKEKRIQDSDYLVAAVSLNPEGGRRIVLVAYYDMERYRAKSSERQIRLNWAVIHEKDPRLAVLSRVANDTVLSERVPGLFRGLIEALRSDL